MADLKTDYKDDVLNTEVNDKRRYRMIQNEDGTVSFEDVTDYLTVGDDFGSAEVNKITGAINGLNNGLYQNTQGQFTLDNGLKMCWGITTDNTGVVVFPITFRSTPRITGMFKNSNESVIMTANVIDANTTGFRFKGEYTLDGTTWNSIKSGFMWFAIGY